MTDRNDQGPTNVPVQTAPEPTPPVPVKPLSTADVAAATGARPAERPAQSDEQSSPLFASDRAQEYRTRWEAIQIGFVDEPRSAVERADGLVAEVIQRLAQSFADERSRLEGQWGSGNDISTEDLRLALRRYRSFFDRLLSV